MASRLMALIAVAVIAGNPLIVRAAEEQGLQPPSDARWRILLKDQLKSEKNCDLLEVLTYSELKIGDEIAISGKVSCVDGRQYDYDRRRPHQMFEIRLCEPSVC